MRGRALAALCVAACTAPPLTIELAIQSGSGGTCPTSPNGATTCTAIPLECPAMLLIRVLDPDAPEQPLISSCQPVIPDKTKDLCAIASVGIGADALPASLPERTLEVQVAVLPTGSDGSATCDAYATTLSFAATGVPQSEAGEPPIAGHAYYHPGDAETVVTLGCVDVEALNACVATNLVAVNASVVELDSQISVSASIAASLDVSIGAPKLDASGSAFALDPAGARELDLAASATPSWSASVDLALGSAACLDVLDRNDPGATATLACRSQVAGKTSLDMVGVHITAVRLGQLVNAVMSTDPTFDPFFGDGLVVGIVLDEEGNPKPGATVTSDTGATVSYIAQDGMSLQQTGTSRSGVFLSTDAPFNTTWTLDPQGGLGGKGFGGLVEKKVTVVVIQLSNTLGT